MAHRNGIITGYTVTVQQSSTPSYFVTGTTFTVPLLHPYQVYNCAVSAHTIVGEGPYTEVLALQTLSDSMCICISLNVYVHCTLLI